MTAKKGEIIKGIAASLRKELESDGITVDRMEKRHRKLELVYDPIKGMLVSKDGSIEKRVYCASPVIVMK